MGNNAMLDDKAFQDELKKYPDFPGQLSFGRHVIDQHNSSTWEKSTLYNSWLNSLRQLSPPIDTDLKKLPSFMQNSAYWVGIIITIKNQSKEENPISHKKNQSRNSFSFEKWRRNWLPTPLSSTTTFFMWKNRSLDPLAVSFRPFWSSQFQRSSSRSPPTQSSVFKQLSRSSKTMKSKGKQIVSRLWAGKRERILLTLIEKTSSLICKMLRKDSRHWLKRMSTANRQASPRWHGWTKWSPPRKLTKFVLWKSVNLFVLT